ncbi:MAG: translocation/assembly module TamB domain-containing protein, partial [Rhodoblastus sp.]
IPKLDLKAQARDVTGAMQATATLDGEIDGKAARGNMAARRDGARWIVEPLDIAIGRVTLKGDVAVNEAGRASGALRLDAPDLDDLSALALQKLAGRLKADVTLETRDGGQDVRIVADGAGVSAQGVKIERLDAKFFARDVLARPALEGVVALDNARIGAETISRARLTAKPAGGGAADLDLTLDARGFAVTGRGKLTPGEATRLDLQQFAAQRAGKRIALAGPASVVLRNGDVDIRNLAVALGSGRLDINGLVGARMDVTANARAVPLSIASMFDPSLGLEGTVDAQARISGTKNALSGDWRLKAARVSAAQLRASGLPALEATASGRLSGARTSLDANVAIGKASRLQVAGHAPLGAGALDLAIKGALDASLANTMLAANGQTLAGRANVDLRLTGAPASPMVGGAVTIADGAFTDPLNGVALTKINGRLEGKGRDLVISSLTARTRNGGQISISGRVNVAPDAGMPGSLRIVANNAQLASSEVVSSIGDLDLAVSGPLARNPRVSGRVTLRSMDINVPDRLPANLKPFPGSTHIDAKGFAKQMLALQRKEKARAGKASKFDAGLDLALSAPNRIFVRGRGIDAEFAGDLKIRGTIQKPNVVGAFDLRRGKLSILTQTIDISQGKLTFAGGLAPNLDFVAQTTTSDVTARVTVSGPASLPTFTFSSTPDLPQDEVLSRLLFAKASGSLTAFQAVQLAGALAQLTGVGEGVGAFEKLRRSLGVDTLDVGMGADGPTVGASRYIANGVNVGVRTGAKPDQTSVNVGIDITKRLRLQSETRVDGKTSVGVGIEWEY